MDIDQSGSSSSNKPKAELVSASDILPGIITILPQPTRPFFPSQAVPLIVDLEAWESTIKAALETPQHVIGALLARDTIGPSAQASEYFTMGTACRIHRVQKHEGKLQVLLEGLQRFRVIEWLKHDRPFRAQVEYFPEPRPISSPEVKAYAVAIINSIKELVPLNPLYGEELKLFLEHFHPNEPSRLADFAASLTTAGKHELQEILETIPIPPRLEKALVLVSKEIQVARAQKQIREQVQQEFEGRQREAFLREQLKAIQKELGLSKDDRTAEYDKFAARIESLKLPEHAQSKIDEELKKFSLLETGSPEYALTRNYLDWLTTLPWGKYSEDILDLQFARQVLEEDHYGLTDVKQRILEFIAVAVTRGSVSGSIQLFVGPPGVGKTSLGRSIAKALGRKFFRFSLGGMRDEAEIKGHRRTYIGAMPGKLLQAIKECGTANPVIMLDEIDKIGMSFHGDPASALLEVLDPEQNLEFLDHYLDVRFDLSKVLFVATANQLDNIPMPLMDRMELIHLPGYLPSEKIEIAKRYLLPRQIARAGLKKSKLRIDKTALKYLVENYAREAGVRHLERYLSAIARKAALRIIETDATSIRVKAQDLTELLGSPPFRVEHITPGVGVVTGLAWTPLGGATLNIEATVAHQQARGLKLTGQLGDVMRESAEIALSYLSSNRHQFAVPEDFLDQAFIHLHVPAGATPKDGPSAGITMTSALLSLARQQAPKQHIAMTGEISLTGQVLPVGGIKEKLIAARRSRCKAVILPAANRGDFEDLPDTLRGKGLAVHFVEQFEQVAEILLPQ